MKLSDLPATTRDTELGTLIREIRKRHSIADEIARKFMLASALEPLSNKFGCTTRYSDLSESKRLEFFVAAGINSGFAIRHMVEHLKATPYISGIYEFMIEAVVMSKFNRKGAKINHGILEPLIPLIAAQVIYYEHVKEDPFRIFSLATTLLMATTRRDVDDLVRAKEIANKISGVEKKYPVRHHDVETVYAYYQQEVATERAQGSKLTAILHNQQFVDQFADIHAMLEVMIASEKKCLLEKVEDAYSFVLQKHHMKIGIGLAADHCAVCLYLYISLISHREPIG